MHKSLSSISDSSSEKSVISIEFIAETGLDVKQPGDVSTYYLNEFFVASESGKFTELARGTFWFYSSNDSQFLLFLAPRLQYSSYNSSKHFFSLFLFVESLMFLVFITQQSLILSYFT